ncbi:MAG: GNAT family N-acetyltransferase [Oscillospiraceae bacterium]|nr:GNAT family N-acetyltransferase [Oscillospiraceae bacterium]
MKLISLKEHPGLFDQALACCKTNWSKVYASFCRTADESVSADTLPQTWLLMGGADDTEILGFCQLVSNDGLTRNAELCPFISTLFVLPQYRDGHGFGELLLTHAKYEAALLGYDKLYVCTDHIGYYERHGFHEIGMDIAVWGSPCKIYCCYTPTEILLRIFDISHPKSDDIHLDLARARWNRSEKNPALLLHWMKHNGFPDSYEGKWMQIIAFRGHDIVGAVNLLRDTEDHLRWYLGDLFVISEYRRHGIARKLILRGIDEIRSKASGGEYIHSYIEAENTASRELHRSLGFSDLGMIVPFCDFCFSDNNTTWELKL